MFDVPGTMWVLGAGCRPIGVMDAMDLMIVRLTSNFKLPTSVFCLLTSDYPLHFSLLHLDSEF